MLEQMQAEASPRTSCSTEPINAEIQHLVCSGMPLLDVSQTSLGCANACGTNNKSDNTREKCTCIWENYKSPCINQQEVVGTSLCLWEGYRSPTVEQLNGSLSLDKRQHVTTDIRSDKKKSGLRARKRHGVSATQMSVAKRTKLLKTKRVPLLNEHDENNHLMGAVVASASISDLSRIGSPERACILADAEKKSNGTLPPFGMPSLKSVVGGGNSSICSLTSDHCSAVDNSLIENGLENLSDSLNQVGCLKTGLLNQNEPSEVLALKSELDLALAEENHSLTDVNCVSAPGESYFIALNEFLG
jgi:hypothetical protein